MTLAAVIHLVLPIWRQPDILECKVDSAPLVRCTQIFSGFLPTGSLKINFEKR